MESPSATPRVMLATVNFSPETSGIAVYTTSLANGLAERGFDVTVIAAAPHYPAWRVWPSSGWASEEVAGGVHISRLKSYVPARPNFLSRALFELLYGIRFAARSFRQIDAVILVSPALISSAVVSARLALSPRRPRTVLWIQDRYSAGIQELSSRGARFAGGVVRAIESWVARAADDVVVIHDRWVDGVVETLGVERQRLTAVPNWSHLSLSERTDIAATRADLGWGKQGVEVVVLHSGNLGIKQGLENVVEAAQIAEKSGLALRFVLMGDGNQRHRLQRLGAGCQNLQFISPLEQSEYAQALVAADILLLNERPGLIKTAVPSKLTSYFAAGRPVLAATEATSVSAEEIRESGAGTVIPPGDPAALVRESLSLADRSTFESGAGPSYARRHLSEDAGVAAFDSILRRQRTQRRQ